MLATATSFREVGQTWSFRGSKSRNKVSVGEPAEGSLINASLHPPFVHRKFSLKLCLIYICSERNMNCNLIQLLTMDLLALASMKNAAKCDK